MMVNESNNMVLITRNEKLVIINKQLIEIKIYK